MKHYVLFTMTSPRHIVCATFSSKREIDRHVKDWKYTSWAVGEVKNIRTYPPRKIR